MKNLRNWAALGALAIFVAGAAAIEAQPSGWLSLYTAASSGATQARGLNVYGAPIFVGRGTSTPAGIDGEVFNVLSTTSTGAQLQSYSSYDNSWNDVKVDGRAQRVFREDFTSGAGQVYEEDLTAAVLTTGSDNIILFPGGEIGAIAYTLIDADSLDAAVTPWSAVGTFNAGSFTDDEDDNNVVFIYPAMADGAVGPGAWNESSGDTGYCEARIEITTISAYDDFWFGMIVQEAYDAPPASVSYDTGAWFMMDAHAGVLDIETELNNGTTPDNDATGTTWAAGDVYILRVETAADSVAFYMSALDAADGAELTLVAAQSNATLNFDDGDIGVCVLGWTNDAGAENAGVILHYIEYGVTQ